MQLDKLRKKMDMMCINKVELYKGLDLLYDGKVVVNGNYNNTDEIITIPDGVEFIGNGNMGSNHMTKVKIVNLPSTIKIIGKGLFRDSTIEEINIPDKVEVINADTFALTKMKKLTFGEESALCQIGANAFTGCKLPEIILPESYMIVDDSAFELSDIQRVEALSDDITLGRNCFRNSGIEEFIGTIGIVGLGAFENCQKLKYIDFSHMTTMKGESFRNSGHYEYVDLQQIKYIGPLVFERVQIDVLDFGENNSMTINASAFYNCEINELRCNEEVYKIIRESYFKNDRKVKIKKWVRTKLVSTDTDENKIKNEPYYRKVGRE